MARKKKESELLHCRLAKDRAKELERFCEETGLTKTVTVEHAIRMFIRHYEETGKIS